MMNSQKGNMYGFVTHTWNVIKGKCPHDCQYCYMKIFKQKEIHFDKKELETDLGANNYIFVGSSCDMFAKEIPAEWIREVLHHCNRFNENTYLFQTKNPRRYFEFLAKGRNDFPAKTILATTIESNRDYTGPHAPLIKERIEAMHDLDGWGFERMITIEPIHDFDTPELVSLIVYSHAKLINIGADSKSHKLPEPSKEKVESLIRALNAFTTITKKQNLTRLMK